MRTTKRRFRCGYTIIELTFANTISMIVILAAAILLVNGNRAWQRTYDLANKEIKTDSLLASIAFGSTGRRANRLDYTLYKFNGDILQPALPITSDPEEVIWADAVEFRYWDVPLDNEDSHDVMDTAKTATAYALFYLHDDKLKVDYGPYPPGAAPQDGGQRNTTGVTTQVLAENVSTEEERGAFSHTALNGVGQGAVRINVVLTDHSDGDTTKLMTAALLRNMWPR